ncbi:MAG: glycosyltransferase [Rhodopirellula sp. JB053]
MRIAASGFVSDAGGSVASANAALLRGLLDAGHEVDFFSKSSFVDPRPSVGNRCGFRFIEADNAATDALRATLEGVPLLGFAACRFDCARYIRILFQQIIKENTTRRYDVVFWMGTYAPKRVPGVPMVSFAQGPPGTDARSVISRFNEVCQLAGRLNALKWRTLAQLRLSPLGLPNFRNSDRIIVGSEQSRSTLHNLFGLPRTITSALPYPIDLDLFHPEVQSTQKRDAFRVLWLGRIIPRKRLDLFLKGVETTIRNGENVTATIVGNVGFIPGYERMIDRFPYPDRITWI